MDIKWENSINFSWEEINSNLSNLCTDIEEHSAWDNVKKWDWGSKEDYTFSFLKDKNKTFIFMGLLYCRPRIKAERWMK